MWLLLAAAGTGYLARCWQKSRKCKSGFSACKHNKAVFSSSQRSPPCTPRRGCSRDASQHGSRKGSQFARRRKLLSQRSEGRLARCCVTNWDGNSGFLERFFEESLHGDNELSGQVLEFPLKGQDACFQVNNLRGNSWETYSSLSFICAQDQSSEASFCMEQPPPFTADIDATEPLFCIELPLNTKPLLGTLHVCSANALDLVKTQLSIGAPHSRNRLDGSEPIKNSSIVSNMISCTSLTPLQIYRIKTVIEKRTQNCAYKCKALTEQACDFFAKMTMEIGQRARSTFTAECLNRMRRSLCWKPGSLQTLQKASVCHSLPNGFSWKEISEKENLSLQMGKCGLNSCISHSHLLKALLDPECLDQCHKWDHTSSSIRGSKLQDAVPCSTHCAGLNMASDRKTIQISDSKSISNQRKGSKGETTAFTEQHDLSINPSLGSNESSFFALGVAMGVAFVASSRNNEFEVLHKLLNRIHLLIEELKKQTDSKFESDLVKLFNAKKYNDKMPSKPTISELTCLWKAHRHSESNPGIEVSSLQQFSAVNNHALNGLSDGHVHGLTELEAELEAELQLLECNVCNTNVADYEWNLTDSNQENWQLEGGDSGLYADVNMRDSMAVQDAEPLYESDFVVPPLELERRLWQVVEQRQEERIGELENDLDITSKKVAAKELEVQWWKDRVWWLLETSLGEKNDNTLPLLSE